MRRRAPVIGAVVAAVVLTGCGGESTDDSGASSSFSASSESPGRSSESLSGSSAAPHWSSGVETPPSLPPPYVDRVEWAQTDVGPSLRIYPTPSGRRVGGDGVADAAWREVLALRPDADTPGMRAQFDCHWSFARIVDPEKTSWNLEPDRPVVSDEEMIASRCNPGFAEEG